MCDAEWPPVLRPDETSDQFITRLNAGIDDQFASWVMNVANGDPTANSEVFELISPFDIAQDNRTLEAVDPTVNWRALARRAIEQGAEDHRAVSNGDPEAVRRYIDRQMDFRKISYTNRPPTEVPNN